MTIGERLKLVRGSVSQDEFSKRLGVSKAAVGAYERNAQMPGLTFIIAICECYNIEPRWLLTGVGPMRPGAEAAHAASDTLPSPAALPGVVEAGCARCLKLEEKLNRTELQRDDAVEQLRQIWDENRRLWRQNADLRERLARLEERFIGKGSMDFSERAG
ncbi:helix-turn-helix domain-containing protein [uncultured Desulfovibrio sp.]|uniref:helix-turn-helix domain-containing protein n=1 Tax=uncultured Desulfovibrio sp. TaxID=167968 RepID=UPI0026DC9A26|nr:helix-turn-helix transcriptional regulator [uncultured Desulfovibrio sp.]